MGRRDYMTDSLKFFLICLVVFGHVLSKIQASVVPNLVEFDGSWGGTLALNCIYSFHMPLFVLLSGYFSKKHVLKSS